VSSVHNLRKEAKRWLKALRANDAEARARLTRAWPAAPRQPGLRDIQHALAREHGHENWTAFKAALAASPSPASAPIETPRDVIARFLQFACWDHHTHGTADHRMYDRAAQRILAQHPDIARHSLYTAIVCGNVREIERILSAQPEAAREAGGSRGWTPILYLSYTRFTYKATLDNALDIARLLLDHGANPNDFYMAGDSEYSCLVGAAGEGEQNSPRQPYAEKLYELLLERGAGPYDIQVLYDTHFSGGMLWWLELTYRRSLALGLKADWDDPDWSMLDMGGYGPGAAFVLGVAVRKNDLDLAAWALSHGASPNPSTYAHPKYKPDRSLYETAVVHQQTEMAALLLRHGARAVTPALRPEEAFIDACMRLDRVTAAAVLDRHPEYRRSHLAIFEAAKRDRADVIALLLDLGVPLEIADRVNTRALHHAAANNALRAAKLLIDRGAEVDPRESSYDATPIGWAAHGDHMEMLGFLSRYSRNVWTLTFRGFVDRLREVLRENPDLARQTDSDGCTPLWWLPDDDAKAREIVELLLAAGADPAKRNNGGRTAADWARTRGMLDIARRLAVVGGEGPAPEDPAATEPADLEEPMATRPIVVPPPDPSGAPIEMRAGFMMRLYDNAIVSTADVWSMLVASRDGHLARVEALLAASPRLVRAEYNYMPPIHLAVREGHLEIVRFLAERGGVNPKYKTYPYNEPLLTVAADRGYDEIAGVLQVHSANADPDLPVEEVQNIEYDSDFERRKFQQLVEANALSAAEALLEKRPELATDPFAFWSEGIMSSPANRGDRDMIELLLEYGARVPDVTKWGREYYFKRYDIAAFLMEMGMNPNHMNVHKTTLLHGMAQIGDVRKATLLLDHGADINAVDEEFRSTPLGFAARWGRRGMVRLLLDRGADRHAAGAEWARPVEWARRKSHKKIAADLH
jgi:ankyrin repeat protein